MSGSPRQTRSGGSRSPRKRYLSTERKSSAAAAKRRISLTCSDTAEKQGPGSMDENFVKMHIDFPTSDGSTANESTDARNRPSTSQHTESDDQYQIGTQFMDMNIEETSASAETRKQRLSKQRSRSANRVMTETPQEKETRLANMKHRVSDSRQNETVEQHNVRLRSVSRRASQRIQNETSEEKQVRLSNRVRTQSQRRANESPEKRVTRQRSDTSHHAQQRELEAQERQEQQRIQQKRDEFQRRHMAGGKSKFLARDINAVFNGTQKVSQHYLGPIHPERGTGERPVNMCQHCNAVKWKEEKTTSKCCSNGKISLLPVFECVPQLFKDLCTGDDFRCTTFRKYIRYLNNGLAMACLKVNKGEVPGGGYQPSTVIQGKVFIGMGPLDPSNPSNKRKFAQLYVMDTEQEELETELRLQNMCLPKSTTSQELAELRSLLHELLRELRASNRYVREYRMAYEMLTSDACPTVKLIIDPEKRPQGAHQRTYNNPNDDQGFKEITVLMDDANPGNRDIIVEVRRDQEVKEIDDTHRSVDALHFVLLFPTGANSWHLNMPQKEGGQAPPNLTGLEYYAYHLHERYSEEEQLVHPLLRSGRLFQEFCCVSFAKVENQRLKWANYNQKTLRAETYEQLADDYQQQQRQGEEGPLRSGTLKILPASIVGSRRNMQRHFQDATAIVREYHKPDIFLTMTCNPKWPEITESLFDGQTAQDRPDLVARVFKMKFDALLKEINQDGIFGRRVGIVYVIEFQKRGLPHAHILIILANEDRISSSDDVDNFVCAELPPDPTSFPEGTPEREQAQWLHTAVLQHMVHTCSNMCNSYHCSEVPPDPTTFEHGSQEFLQAERMQEIYNLNHKCSNKCKVVDSDVCRKHFPKPHSEYTIWDENGFYPNYRRRPMELTDDEKEFGPLYNRNRGFFFEAGGSRLRPINSTDIVPYNPYLLLRYNCHMNVEVCVSALAAKYLFKYVTKGPDRLMVKVAENDEIAQYQDLRAIGACEGCWRLLKFDISGNFPPVKVLRIHLENRQMTTFDPDNAVAAVEAGPKKTELDGFFEYNSNNPECREKYVDFPKHFTEAGGKWKPRKTHRSSIGRVHSVHPLAGDVFYLRMLLHDNHCRGAKSFQDLRTLDDKLYDTYQEICKFLGLLRDDKEWDDLLTDAALERFPRGIRALFVVLLLYCEVSTPLELFNKHCSEWVDDFKRKHPTATDEQLQQLVLLDIDQRLQGSDKRMSDFALPQLDDTEKEQLSAIMKDPTIATAKQSVIEQEELSFDMEQTKKHQEYVESCLNDDQKTFYSAIVAAVEAGQGGAFFLSAVGGTGKTFLINGLLAKVRTLYGVRNVALAVASSGIAATLLHQGRTFHSRFKSGICPTETMTFNITPVSCNGKLIAQAKLIVWDEAPMTHRFYLEGLDRSLRDITGVDEPFGGIVVVLLGDFRQVLPVIEHGSRVQTTDASMKQSPLWQSAFEVFSLTQNLRVGLNPERQQFAEWLVKLGNGDLPIAIPPDMIELPNESVLEIDVTDSKTVHESLLRFINVVFPGLAEKAKAPPSDWTQWISERAILAPRNIYVDEINDAICKLLPGEPTKLTSADSTKNPDDALRFPVEYLNSLTPTGLPPHELNLKPNMIVMLIRNINAREGLCNGTRLIVDDIKTYFLRCRIAKGQKFGETVLIPRIELTPKETDKENPFPWRRRQFPVRPAFAMSINKSQGQTLDTVGVWLKEPCFAHGQLYVAASRVGDPSKIHFAVKQDDLKCTRNIVYKEALLD